MLFFLVFLQAVDIPYLCKKGTSVRHWKNKGNFKIFETWVLKDFFYKKKKKVEDVAEEMRSKKITEIDSLKKLFFVKSLSSMQILEELGTRKKLDGEEWTPWKYCIFWELFYLVKIYVHQFWKFSSNETANMIKMLAKKKPLIMW